MAKQRLAAMRKERAFKICFTNGSYLTLCCPSRAKFRGLPESAGFSPSAVLAWRSVEVDFGITIA